MTGNIANLLSSIVGRGFGYSLFLFSFWIYGLREILGSSACSASVFVFKIGWEANSSCAVLVLLVMWLWMDQLLNYLLPPRWSSFLDVYLPLRMIRLRYISIFLEFQCKI
ncbi:hypothetical protein HS088_TW18G01075 [Tripterygium wilfordii]|uniref:Uncharacterized protein n=1 Tax=Tripterygium wilfordii TaxID=458696 RepID=A0A7J7CDY6_TRIWF|nr:hypothetical protein HS088_TW18G01075 [Tripterygium wilfordii]